MDRFRTIKVPTWRAALAVRAIDVGVHLCAFGAHRLGHWLQSRAIDWFYAGAVEED